jgi:hypothetical protein
MVSCVLEQYLRVARTMTCGVERGASVEVGVRERDVMSRQILAQQFEEILVFHVWKL